MTTTPLAVEATGLVKTFGSNRAVDGVDLRVEAGTVYGVLGPNGAGKTTTISMLATLLKPDGGEARVFGHDVRREPQTVRSLIGVTGQYASVDETLSAMDDLVRAGKVRYIGCSNVVAWQIADWDWSARTARTSRFVVVQNPGNLLDKPLGADVTDACGRYGLGLVPAWPLANGLLTGKFRRDEAPAGTRLVEQKPHLLESAPWDLIEALQGFADDRGITLLQLGFGWLLAQPQVSSVIAGATTPEQIQANADAADAWSPDEDELSALDALLTGAS